MDRRFTFSWAGELAQSCLSRIAATVKASMATKAARITFCVVFIEFVQKVIVIWGCPDGARNRLGAMQNPETTKRWWVRHGKKIIAQNWNSRTQVKKYGAESCRNVWPDDRGA